MKLFEKFGYLFDSENSPNILLKNLKTFPLIVFLLSNLAYLPVLLKVKNIEFIIILLVFVASTFYHTVQVLSRNSKDTKSCRKCCGCMYLDMLLASIAGFFVLIKYRQKINTKVIVLAIISLIIFVSHWIHPFCNGYYYLYLHSIWHITTAMIAYLLLV